MHVCVRYSRLSMYLKYFYLKQYLQYKQGWKNPGFFKKLNPLGFMGILLSFIGVFWVF